MTTKFFYQDTPLRFLGRALRFGAVGIASNLALFTVFWLLVQAGANPYWTSAGLYATAVIGTYLANRVWSFQSRQPHGRGIVRYFAVYGLGLVVMLSFMAVFHGMLGLPAVAVQFICIFVVAALMFVLLETYVFPFETRAPKQP